MTLHTFHQSLIRPNLILGCDRDLFFVSGLAAFILIIMSHNWTASFIGAFIWFSALALLQRMAKADPLMRPVYLRHRRHQALINLGPPSPPPPRRYQAYYPPRSTPYRMNPRDYREF